MLLTFEELSRLTPKMSKSAGSIDVERYSAKGMEATIRELYAEEERQAQSVTYFDVFMSHSGQDARLNPANIIRIRDWLERTYKLSVYVDWIVDPLLDRTKVSAATAATLRRRMMQSDCLFYVTSQHYQSSVWMHWELGFKDGHLNRHKQIGRCAVLPVVEEASKTSTYKGTEYLELYPYVEKSPMLIQPGLILSAQVKSNSPNPVPYPSWVHNGRNPS